MKLLAYVFLFPRMCTLECTVVQSRRVSAPDHQNQSIEIMRMEDGNTMQQVIQTYVCGINTEDEKIFLIIVTL